MADVRGGGSDPLARAEKSQAMMEATEPEGMVSRPHICVWSDQLSHANRDVIALASELAGLRGRLAETEAERDGSQFLKDCAEAALLKKEHEAEALRVERDTAVAALRQIADPTNHHYKPGYVRPEVVAHEALAAVGGTAA